MQYCGPVWPNALLHNGPGYPMMSHCHLFISTRLQANFVDKKVVVYKQVMKEKNILKTNILLSDNSFKIIFWEQITVQVGFQDTKERRICCSIIYDTVVHDGPLSLHTMGQVGPSLTLQSILQYSPQLLVGVVELLRKVRVLLNGELSFVRRGCCDERWVVQF